MIESSNSDFHQRSPCSPGGLSNHRQGSHSKLDVCALIGAFVAVGILALLIVTTDSPVWPSDHGLDQQLARLTISVDRLIQPWQHPQ